MHTQPKNDRAAWLHGPADECSMPARAENARRLILLGAPGVGKGTQAQLLSQLVGACHLSTGDVFRAACSRPECEQSPAMAQATELMRRGELVPDSVVWAMVRERAKCLHCGGGFILDGFPRTLAQAESLKTLMDDEAIPLHAVISYELPLDEIVSRLSGRRTCRQCKAVYHMTAQPPAVAGICDRCGGELFQREDDRPESITVRMQAYERSTMPLIRFYSDLGLLFRIPATGSPEEICARSIAALEFSDPAIRQ